jgi:hypothetical protein
MKIKKIITTLIIINDVSEYEYLILHKRSLITEATYFITNDATVVFELNKTEFKYINEWKYINSIELESNQKIADFLVKKWWSNFDFEIPFNDEVLGTTENELIITFLTSLNAKTIYNKIFNEYHIKKIIFFNLKKISMSRNGPGPSTIPISGFVQSIRHYYAKLYNIDSEFINTNIVLKNTKIYSKLNVKNQLNSIRKKYLQPQNDKKRKKLILIYEALIPSNEYEILKKFILEMPDIDEIYLPIAFIECKNLAKKYINGIDYKIKISRKYAGKYDEIFNNPYIIYQFESIISSLFEAKCAATIFGKYLDLFKPNIVVFGYDSFIVEQLFQIEAKNRNINKLSLIHGALGNKFGYKYLRSNSDYLAVWNDTDYECMKHYGFTESKLYKIGALRYLKNYNEYIQRKNNNIFFIPNNKKYTKTIVLITSEINTGIAFAYANPIIHVENLTRIINYIKSKPEYLFIIKAHPSTDYYSLYRNLIGISNLKFEEGKTLDYVLHQANLCIMINYCSSAAIEIILKNIPLLYLKIASYSSPEWIDNFSHENSLILSEFNNLDNEIDDLLFNSSKIKSNLLTCSLLVDKILNLSSYSNPLKKLLNKILIKNNSNDGIYSDPDVFDINTFNDYISYDLSFLINALPFACGYLNQDIRILKNFITFYINNEQLDNNSKVIYSKKMIYYNYILGKTKRWHFPNKFISEFIIILKFLFNSLLIFKLKKNELILVIKYIYLLIFTRYFNKKNYF